MVTKFLLLILSLIATQDVVLCGIASTWDYCGCNWVTWMAWSDCSKSCGGGRRYRSREVSIRTDKCALDFNVCATDDMGWEFSDCNTICFNGGTFSSVCVCLIGWYGSCCSNGKFINMVTYKNTTNKILLSTLKLKYRYNRHRSWGGTFLQRKWRPGHFCRLSPSPTFHLHPTLMRTLACNNAYCDWGTCIIFYSLVMFTHHTTSWQSLTTYIRYSQLLFDAQRGIFR